MRIWARISVPLCVMVAAAACAPDTDTDADATPASEQPVTTVTVDETPQDSAIFEETVAWARAEGIDTLAFGDMVAEIGQRFVGDPYVPGTLDPEGEERLIVNLREFDCVTFVESVLAIARTLRDGDGSYGYFKDQLMSIRYRNGEMSGYPSRLHYFSEWIADNDAKGVVRNVTRDLGGEQDAEEIRFMTEHVDAYRQLADSANLTAIREREAALNEVPRYYIPQENVAGVADQIENGDVIAATSTLDGLDIAHTGFALWVDGELHLMHAPLVGSNVEISDLPLAERLLGIDAQDGIMVARPQ